MRIIDKPLPLYCHSSHPIHVKGLIIHHISAKNIKPDDPYDLETIYKIFVDYQVSAHYMIDRDGTVYRLVPEKKIAWHAGKSILNGIEGCNSFTIGVELVGRTEEDYTPEQYMSLQQLTAECMSKYGFTTDWIAGHRQIRADYKKKYPNSTVADKHDPRKEFDMEAFLEPLKYVVPSD